MKTDIIRIQKAEYLGDFRIRILFSDGHINTVDFGHFLSKSGNPMVVKYREEKLFKKFNLQGGDLNWNNYEMSFSFEDVYKLKRM